MTRSSRGSTPSVTRWPSAPTHGLGGGVESVEGATDYLGDKINNPLGVILGDAERPATAASSDATTDAAASVRAAVRRINELARTMVKRDQPSTA